MKTLEFGRHTLTYNDDGVSVMVYRGRVTYEEMAQILASEDLSNVPPVVLVIADLRELTEIDSDARRLGATSPKPAQRYYTAYVGASLALQLIVSVWNRAANLLHGKKYTARFFDDHASGHAWLLAERAAFERGQR